MGSFFMDSRLSAAVSPFLGTSGAREKPFMAHFPAVPHFAASRLQEQELHGADGSDLRAEDPQLKAHFLA
ncbi:hypothetical protein IVA79_09525 [Bradyrhizobium sp. 138]|uniref:hypothetical protein n=1 Tax=Bradyrhizobium sp. 138 TaxID=2782615 RepID=UPI001FF7D2D2|nr:hypothetical protein [Bradyrhizobium sp. 138]MCK1734188.1 hypothetical protein [Bradyrhizobium sp. 138]